MPDRERKRSALAGELAVVPAAGAGGAVETPRRVLARGRRAREHGDVRAAVAPARTAAVVAARRLAGLLQARAPGLP